MWPWAMRASRNDRSPAQPGQTSSARRVSLMAEMWHSATARSRDVMPRSEIERERPGDAKKHGRLRAQPAADLIDAEVVARVLIGRGDAGAFGDVDARLAVDV